MNRSERRAAARGRKTLQPAEIDGLMADASQAYREGRSTQAEAICKQILERQPGHKTSWNLLGVINQGSGRHRLAVKMFAKAIALDDLDAACHYNIACSYQLLDERGAAATHFHRALTLGMSDKDVEAFLLQNPDIVACVQRVTDQTSLPTGSDDLLGHREIAALANDIFLRCALQTTIIRGATLEIFLTHLRAALLRLATTEPAGPSKTGDDMVGLFGALAQQCFLNEYVFGQGDEETQQAERWRELLRQRLADGGDTPPLMLAAVAAYFPLHTIAGTQSLRAGPGATGTADLLRQQVREPLQEAEERRTIPALTAVEDATSLQVMQQYEENPYPRWSLGPLARTAGDETGDAAAAERSAPHVGQDILIAGCGTGQHAVDVAQNSPDARILAVDISRASLAYAQRKTREARLVNIEYAQADILKLGSTGRSFDRIEAVGVLHHLAEPKVGCRVLLSLLRPGGIMRIGLYSEAARRSVVEARALSAERGYHATAQGIRALRQLIVRHRDEPRWKILTTTVDFYSMSGCRDLLFNVMEHRFTIPEIATFLNEQGLSFLGFELDARIAEAFARQHPDAEALTDLECWHAFEAANPQTFRHMYVFSVRSDGRASHRRKSDGGM